MAIQNLSPEYRARLDRIWREARLGYTTRLTESVIDPTQGLKPLQLDYASWSAIAGDHSSSPQEMLHNVLQTEWILKVANIAAQLDIDIKNSKIKVSISTASAIQIFVYKEPILNMRQEPEQVMYISYWQDQK